MTFKIIISSLFLLFGSLSQTSLEIRYQKSNLKIDQKKINDQNYLTLNDLRKIFVLNNNILSNEYFLNYKDEELIFSELSFFVVYRNSSQMRVAQMSHPVIKINEELLIPINPFLQAMNSLNLINSKLNGNKYIDIIDYSIFEPDLIYKNEITAPDFIKKNEIEIKKVDTLTEKKRSVKEIINIFDYDSIQKTERGKYIIPRSIKK